MTLALEHVTKKYETFALDCTLRLEQGQVTGLIGQNGAGKSTVYKLILGLIFSDGGRIQIFGKDQSSLTIKEREDIGVVLADSGFSGYLKIKDLLPIMEGMYTNFDHNRFLRLCERFKLPANQKIKEFSTGMKAKLKIFAALSHGAKLLLLDEPTAGLDVIARDELLDLLREYMEQGTNSILISSHISGDLESICDDLYMIHDGKIILHEDTDELLSNYAVLKTTEDQYRNLDKRYLLKRKKESYGYSCLTDKRRFYTENYPNVSMEKGNIDEVISMMIRGESDPEYRHINHI